MSTRVVACLETVRHLPAGALSRNQIDEPAFTDLLVDGLISSIPTFAPSQQLDNTTREAEGASCRSLQATSFNLV